MYFDDYIMGSEGGNCSFPIGSGSVRLLKPVADEAIGAWTRGAGGTTNLYQAVDNIPHAGLADGAMTDNSQIVSATNGSDYRCTLEPYNTYVDTSYQRLATIQAVAAHARNTTATSQTGNYWVASNPNGGNTG